MYEICFYVTDLATSWRSALLVSHSVTHSVRRSVRKLEIWRHEAKPALVKPHADTQPGPMAAALKATDPEPIRPMEQQLDREVYMCKDCRDVGWDYEPKEGEVIWSIRPGAHLTGITIRGMSIAFDPDMLVCARHHKMLEARYDKFYKTWTEWKTRQSK